MPACPQCHTELEPGWEQCGECGYRPSGREWEGTLGEPAGLTPGVGAPRWSPGPGSSTNGNGHAHRTGRAPPPERKATMRWVLVAAAIGLVVLVVVLVAIL